MKKYFQTLIISIIYYKTSTKQKGKFSFFIKNSRAGDVKNKSPDTITSRAQFPVLRRNPVNFTSIKSSNFIVVTE